jgi:PHAX RNA-binding domain
MIGPHTTGEGVSMREAVTASAIARVLRESQRLLIARALKVLGQERCVELLAEALLCEHHGGLLVKDGSRRRTRGGVFLQLCRERSTPEERRKIFR